MLREYVGSGPLAELAAEADRTKRELAEAEPKREKTELERLDALAAPILEVSEAAEILAHLSARHHEGGDSRGGSHPLKGPAHRAGCAVVDAHHAAGGPPGHPVPQERRRDGPERLSPSYMIQPVADLGVRHQALPRRHQGARQGEEAAGVAPVQVNTQAAALRGSGGLLLGASGRSSCRPRASRGSRC